MSSVPSCSRHGMELSTRDLTMANVEAMLSSALASERSAARITGFCKTRGEITGMKTVIASSSAARTSEALKRADNGSVWRQLVAHPHHAWIAVLDGVLDPTSSNGVIDPTSKRLARPPAEHALRRPQRQRPLQHSSPRHRPRHIRHQQLVVPLVSFTIANGNAWASNASRVTCTTGTPTLVVGPGASTIQILSARRTTSHGATQSASVPQSASMPAGGAQRQQQRPRRRQDALQLAASSMQERTTFAACGNRARKMISIGVVANRHRPALLGLELLPMELTFYSSRHQARGKKATRRSCPRQA